MITLEKEIEEKLRQMVTRHGGQCLKWVCPGWSGVPDRILLLPGGKVLFCETKRPKGGDVAALQNWWRKQLIGLGFESYFVRDVADIAALELVILDKLGQR